MLEHGGKLRHAARQYNIPLENWLDLSTGINPNGWSVPMIPAEAWVRLPEDEDDLIQAAKSYYGASNILPVAGSQAAIQALPLLRKKSRVAILSPAYAEHAYAWKNAQHELIPLAFEAIGAAINTDAFDVLLLVNPNNPTGQQFSTETLLAFHKKLSAHGGWLIIDEAFIDSIPENSLAPLTNQQGLIVLRSLGKFFGLAGARVGFVLAEYKLLEALKDKLGPWAISGPARFIASQALQDRTWQEMMRLQLSRNGQRLQKLLSRHDLTPTGGTMLFQWLRSDRALMIHEQLAQQGILTRLFDHPHSIRFGLPGNESDWKRLDTALSMLQA